MKLNRKGFTLIELLSIIVIISLVSGITITIALGAIQNAKSKSKQITIKNIESQAEKYVYEEYANQNWHQGETNTEYQCVTVRDLVEAGYFKQNIIDENSDIVQNNYTIMITRDTNNKAIISKKLQNEHLTNECNQIANNSSVITCSYDNPNSWVNERNVTIKYNVSNMDSILNEMYLNKISFDPESITGMEADSQNIFHYTTDKNNEVKIKVTSNGSIYANTLSNSSQIGSLACIIDKIDNSKPTISIMDTDEVWINTVVGITIFVSDDEKLENPDVRNINKDNIIPIVNGIEKTENVTKSISISGTATDNEIQYRIIFVGLSGDGPLTIKIKENTFFDKAGNGNEEIILNTNVKVDNTIPKLLKVIDSDGNNCYNSRNNTWVCNTWHNNINYSLESYFDPETGNEYASPIFGGYLSDSQRLTSFNTNYFMEFPIISNYLDDGKYMYILDEAGNYNLDGYGPYKILVDTNPPLVDMSKSGNNITCNISDSKSGVTGYKICKEGTCNSTSYTTISAVNNKSITQNGVADGVWYCYGKDAAGNESNNSVNVQNTPINIDATFKAYYYGTENTYNGSWTNQSITLKATITHNSSDIKYVIDNSSTNPSSGWTNYTSQVTRDLTTNTDQIYYLHIKYKNAGGTYEYDTKQLTVKIDKNSPTCSLNITSNNKASGISVTKTCTDTGGSGCTNNTTTYSGIKNSQTYTVTDNAGNTGTCPNLTVSRKGRKQYCDAYREKCKIDVTEFYNWAHNHIGGGTFNPESLNDIVRCTNPSSLNIPNKTTTYKIKMPLKDIRAGYKRCSYKSYNSQKPVTIGVKAAFYCPYYEFVTDNGSLLNISHSAYVCNSYEDSFDSSTTCTDQEDTLIKPNSGNWYKCVYVYYGKIE